MHLKLTKRTVSQQQPLPCTQYWQDRLGTWFVPAVLGGSVCWRGSLRKPACCSDVSEITTALMPLARPSSHSFVEEESHSRIA